MSEHVQTRVRVGGSAFTIFAFGGQPIAFAQQVSYTSPQPVGGGVEAIQPMDAPYPVQIITPAAAGMGQIVLNLFELFGSGGATSKVWDRLGLAVGDSKYLYSNEQTAVDQKFNGNTGVFYGLNDIVEIFITQAKKEPHQLNISKIIKPAGAGGDTTPYVEEYHGCVITNVADGEQISVGTMQVLKQITVSFTRVTRGGKPSLALEAPYNELPEKELVVKGK